MLVLGEIFPPKADFYPACLVEPGTLWVFNWGEIFTTLNVLTYSTGAAHVYGTGAHPIE